MRFRPGDLVIKNTGGNKMRIVDYDQDGKVDCVWATDNLNEGLFNEDDLISINEYKSVMISEEREDIIDKILKD